MPRALSDILHCIAERRRLGYECSLRASYVEIYGNEINDLLAKGAPVSHSRVAAEAFVVQGHRKWN